MWSNQAAVHVAHGSTRVDHTQASAEKTIVLQTRNNQLIYEIQGGSNVSMSLAWEVQPPPSGLDAPLVPISDGTCSPDGTTWHCVL